MIYSPQPADAWLARPSSPRFPHSATTRDWCSPVSSSSRSGPTAPTGTTTSPMRCGAARPGSCASGPGRTRRRPGQGLLQCEEPRRLGTAPQRTLHCHQPRAAAAELASALRRCAGAPGRERPAAGQDGLQAAAPDRPGHVSVAQMHRRTRHTCTWHRRCKCRPQQSRAGLPAVFTARPRLGRWRRVLGLSGLQSEAPTHVVHSLTAPRTKQSSGQRGS